MIEKIGSIFESGCNCICIPTNGMVKKDGCLVMGKGLAKEAADRYPTLPQIFGRLTFKYGIGTYIISINGIGIACVPTKLHFKDPSSLDLVINSSKKLVELIDRTHWKKIGVPRLGCGLGGLTYSIVKPYLEKIFEIENEKQVLFYFLKYLSISLPILVA